MALTQREIRDRALAFSREWAGETRERAEAQTFWNEFFDIFGITRRRIASFEEPVRLLGERRGSIDLFWRGTLVAEHKSLGEDLEKAYGQALEYFPGLTDDELPKYVIVSDFASFRFYDLDEGSHVEFPIIQLPEHIHHFGFISGYRKHPPHPEDPVNIEAAERVALLHDKLKESGYSGHALELFLVRIVYCLFADDTGVFPKDQFEYLIKTRGSHANVGAVIAEIFQLLDTPLEIRQSTFDEDFLQMPYVDGSLFSEPLPIAVFDSEMTELLLNCCAFDWGQVSPAVFGSMFQAVMDDELRRNLGAHYTSEANIMKVVKSLFLDTLHEEFKEAGNSARSLRRLHDRLSNLRFLDPACGCGNFLVITYRELRLLEMKILLKLRDLSRHDHHQLVTDVSALSRLDVDSMIGIEIEEFPARIAEVALWLTDHQMNMQLSQEFGLSLVRLPLRTRAKIVIGNALRQSWEELVPKNQLKGALTSLYILGNPPFVGKKARSAEQNKDMSIACDGISNYGSLDYVCAWYFKAADIIAGTTARVALVSTNSITQGEQVSLMWRPLLDRGVSIDFAHRTFKWSNEAPGQAQVFCVIIGFSRDYAGKKFIFDYDTPTSSPLQIGVKNINPYLVEAENILVGSRAQPISDVPKMRFGSMPNDGGYLLLTEEEKQELLLVEPNTTEYIRPIASAHEFLHGIPRWCIWLDGVSPDAIRNMPEVRRRVGAVRAYRESSRREATRELAKTPSLFGEIRQPQGPYVLVPRHTSENRTYVPLAFFGPDTIAHDSCLTVPDASLFHFGVLSSAMHMSWLRQVCGRIKGDYRYSAKLVYNNFPWPENVNNPRSKSVEEAAEALLLQRNNFPEATLADLYDPLVMPKGLVLAHKDLDNAVDKCYRAKFSSELGRLNHLFSLYKKLSSPLIH